MQNTTTPIPAQDVRIDQDDAPRAAGPTDPDGTGADARQRELSLAELQRLHILAVLKRHGGDRLRTAEVLGMPARALARRLKEYGLPDED